MFGMVSINEIGEGISFFFESVVVFVNNPVKKDVYLVFLGTRKLEIKGEVFIHRHVLEFIMSCTTNTFSYKLYRNNFLGHFEIIGTKNDPHNRIRTRRRKPQHPSVSSYFIIEDGTRRGIQQAFQDFFFTQFKSVLSLTFYP